MFCSQCTFSSHLSFRLFYQPVCCYSESSFYFSFQTVVSKGTEVMSEVLGWDSARTEALLQACQAQLAERLQQVQAVQSLRSDT